MNIEYRKATIDDAYGVAYVSAHSWRETYSELVPEEYLNNKINNINNSVKRTEKFLSNHLGYLVALDNNKVIGICEFNEDDKKYGKIGALYLLKEYQGYGIGKKLFMLGIKGLIDMRFNDMKLECMSGNKTVNFYKKYGGIIIDTIDFSLRDGTTVKADVLEFNNLKEIYEEI